MKPFVRIVICAYNGRTLTERCLDSIVKLDWPTDRVDVVVVDNGSTDGTSAFVHDRYPAVRVLRSEHNLGFAGGNNLGLSALNGVDYVALLNNDVVVEPDWLGPLADALDADAELGAVCPKVLFDARFFDVALRAPGHVTAPGARELGVRVDGVDVPTDGPLPQAQFISGFYDPELDDNDRIVRWSGTSAVIRVPLPPDGDTPTRFRLALGGEEKPLTVTTDSDQIELEVGPAARWFDVPVGAQTYEVLNNVGSVLFEAGFGGDRGFRERDTGQYDTGAEVFAWCGCSVLLRADYLRDVGLFDERFFLYYEDLDLSWRGRARGWRYAYIPGSVVRHIHSASTTEHSALHRRYVERNRLLMLLRNASKALCRQAFVGYLQDVWSDVRAATRARPAGRGIRLRTAARRLRVLGEVVWLSPGMLRSRAALRARQSVPDAELEGWMVAR